MLWLWFEVVISLFYSIVIIIIIALRVSIYVVVFVMPVLFIVSLLLRF